MEFNCPSAEEFAEMVMEGAVFSPFTSSRSSSMNSVALHSDSLAGDVSWEAWKTEGLRRLRAERAGYAGGCELVDESEDVCRRNEVDDDSPWREVLVSSPWHEG